MASIRNTLLLTLSAASVALAGQHDCSAIVTDGKKFDLKKLGGTKVVHNVELMHPAYRNTTFSVDICAPLTEDSSLSREERCSGGTYVCAREYVYNKQQNIEVLESVRDIAGQYSASSGRALDPKYTRLKGSADHANADREGVRLELNGGKFPNTRSGKKQKAIIEFVCDKEWTGLEGFEGDSKETVENATMKWRRDGEGESEGEGGDGENEDEPLPPNPDEGKALQFESFKSENDDQVDVLRLTWKTKYACEDAAEKGDEDEPNQGKKKSGSWGFFTWFLIIVFLLAATYIIFGSWLNYNRYGARGWDLVPHGDAIRDIPYIIKDWGQSAVDRLRGESGSRGGYSAV